MTDSPKKSESGGGGAISVEEAVQLVEEVYLESSKLPCGQFNEGAYFRCLAKMKIRMMGSPDAWLPEPIFDKIKSVASNSDLVRQSIQNRIGLASRGVELIHLSEDELLQEFRHVTKTVVSAGNESRAEYEALVRMCLGIEAMKSIPARLTAVITTHLQRKLAPDKPKKIKIPKQGPESKCSKRQAKTSKSKLKKRNRNNTPTIDQLVAVNNAVNRHKLYSSHGAPSKSSTKSKHWIQELGKPVPVLNWALRR